MIHGHGTGRAARGGARRARRHPLVARAEPAPPDEGGDGATIAYLAALSPAADGPISSGRQLPDVPQDADGGAMVRKASSFWSTPTV